MRLDILRSPTQFLEHFLGNVPDLAAGRADEAWWESEGKNISASIDRDGTPWMRMFNQFGERVDEVLFPPEYWKMLRRGYQSGVVWRAFEQNSFFSTCALMYGTAFYDPGVGCPHTVSLATALPLVKYGDPELQLRFLPHLLRKDESVWQGATWMTEIKGGSDLGANVETVAVPVEERWLLTGDKYFASNVGAELAVVAARPEGAVKNVRGLALFLVPRHRASGQLNYFIRRLKDKIATRSVPTGEVELRESEAYLLGSVESGFHLILEILNLSRVANSIASVALAQRAIAEALNFAEGRMAFGRRILDHPLIFHQFEHRIAELESGFALAWEAVKLLSEVWQQRPPYSDRYHLFRLIAHLAKYWTAELAVQTAKWSMEVHGGLGVLQEFGIERWLREAIILSIWEGTSHRQILDGLEVMERKRAHTLLFEHLAADGASQQLREIESLVEYHLALPQVEKEANAEDLFSKLAAHVAHALPQGPQN
jgi:alkylation response protein AidB-like acyl-CoA dehydrogenase